MYLPIQALSESDLQDIGITPKEILKGIYIDHSFDLTAVWYGPRFFRGEVRPIYLVLSV